MRSWVELPFKKVILYIPEDMEHVQGDDIVRYLNGYIPLPVELRQDIFHEPPIRTLSKELAECRVREIDRREFHEPLPIEVEIERKMLKGKRFSGILYDGHRVARVLREYIDRYDIHHIVVTDRLIGTMERYDARYHARTVVCSIPSIISTEGIVQGPAKPREYYTGTEDDMGFSPMEPEDPRMTDAIKTYALQSVVWRMTGEPFCRTKECALHNSHWQEELVRYQLKGELCDAHRELFQRFQNFIYSKEDDCS